MLFDIYVIGDCVGFYVGQAKHKKTGGWKRRIMAHMNGKRGASLSAHRLLVGGARSKCLGSVCTLQEHINLFEARTWDSLVARNWIPVHPRPRASIHWNPEHTPTSRAKISAALKGRAKTPQMRVRLSAAKQGHPVSRQTRDKISIAARNRPRETRIKQAAALRGHPLPPEHRAKISAALQGKPHSIEHTAKVAAALRRRYLLKGGLPG